MLKKDVQIGGIYIVKVSGNLVRVKILDESNYGGWYGINLETDRKVWIKTSVRLRRTYDEPRPNIDVVCGTCNGSGEYVSGLHHISCPDCCGTGNIEKTSAV